jgi:hypothetical protein
MTIAVVDEPTVRSTGAPSSTVQPGLASAKRVGQHERVETVTPELSTCGKDCTDRLVVADVRQPIINREQIYRIKLSALRAMIFL